MIRHSRSQADVRGPVLHSARTTGLRSAGPLRRFVLDSMTTGSRIASYSQRVGSLSAGSGQCLVVWKLGSLALVPKLEARARAAQPDRDDDFPRALDQDMVRDQASSDIIGKLPHLTRKA